MKAPQTHPNFAADVKKFVVSACRQRLMLLRTGKSNSTNPRLYDIAKGLETDVKMIHADMQAASFLNRRAAEVLQLLPGKNCIGIQERVNTFNKLYYTSKQILS